MNNYLQRALLARSALLILCSFILHACSTQPVSVSVANPEAAYEVRQKSISQIAQWSLQARIAIKTSNDSHSGNINWLQSKDNVELNIKGAFGVNVAKIKSTGGRYTLQDRKGSLWYANNINQLIYEQTGWALPVQQLQHWVLADTQNNNNTTHVINNDGTLATLNFQQWQVEYEKYMQVNDIRLPAKIRINHPDITIKLLIRKWDVDNG